MAPRRPGRQTPTRAPRRPARAARPARKKSARSESGEGGGAQGGAGGSTPRASTAAPGTHIEHPGHYHGYVQFDVTPGKGADAADHVKRKATQPTYSDVRAATISRVQDKEGREKIIVLIECDTSSTTPAAAIGRMNGWGTAVKTGQSALGTHTAFCCISDMTP